MNFIPSYTSWSDQAGQTAWESPSNIALVKYWGKTGRQLPANPSLSFTLSECHTQTRLFWQPKKQANPQTVLLLDGQQNEKFAQKTQQFIASIHENLPFLVDFDLEIHTHNSFPHSSGIASSASGMSALALALCSMEAQLCGSAAEGPDFLQKASYLARLGSGSACRSVYGGLVSWGSHPDLPNSSALWGTQYQQAYHPVFDTLCDAVLLVHAGEKSVSSSVGHALMHQNPFADARFAFAETQITALLPILASGDLAAFGALIEREALMLHALMMSSSPYFLLFKPNSVAIIEKIWDFRKQTGLPVYFTMDAGANVHIIYFEQDHAAVKAFIDSALLVHCSEKGYICDSIGRGPRPLTV